MKSNYPISTNLKAGSKPYELFELWIKAERKIQLKQDLCPYGISFFNLSAARLSS